MLVPRKVPACQVQAGFFRDENGNWEIVRVDVERDGRRAFILRGRGNGRGRGRWKAPAVPADEIVTVYENVTPER